MSLDFDIMYDSYPENVRKRRHINFWLDDQTYELVRNEVVHNPKLPFNGDLSHFMRYCVARGLEDAQESMSEQGHSHWHAQKQAQRHLTTERFVTTSDDLLDEQAQNLLIWTDADEWELVMNDLEQWRDIVYTYGLLRPRLARAFLEHEGIKHLYQRWIEDMPQPERTQRIFEEFDEWAS